MESKVVFENFYWLRAISCLSVVLIHSISIALSLYGDDTYNYAKYIQLFLMYATPSFIIISEFLISNSYGNNLPKNFLKNRFLVLFVPYVINGLLFALLLAESFSDFVAKSYQFIILADSLAYFIIIILQFYLLHDLFSKHINKINPLIGIALAFLFNVFYLLFFKFTNHLSGFEYFWNRGHLMLFPAWIFYFIFGYYLGRYYTLIQQSFKKFRLFYLFGFLFSFGIIFTLKYLGILESVSSKRIDMLLYTAFFVLLILSIFNQVKNTPSFILLINKYSFNIYLIHALVLNLFTGHITNYFWIDVLILFFISLISSVLIAKIIQLNKYGYLIFGKSLKVRR